jgi:hypothetical protein
MLERSHFKISPTTYILSPVTITTGLRVFENRVLRRIFGPKRDEVTGEWRKLQNEELRNLYSSPDIQHHHHNHHRLESPAWALAFFKSFPHSFLFNAKFLYSSLPKS